jgi:hypothetical protein
LVHVTRVPGSIVTLDGTKLLSVIEIPRLAIGVQFGWGVPVVVAPGVPVIVEPGVPVVVEPGVPVEPGVSVEPGVPVDVSNGASLRSEACAEVASNTSPGLSVPAWKKLPEKTVAAITSMQIAASVVSKRTALCCALEWE